MREEQYRSICEACDHALLAPDATLERVAIPWLHVIREHPFTLTQYRDVIHPVKGLGAWIQRLAQSLWSRGRWGYQMLQAIRSKGNLWFGGDLPEQIDILIVSHLVNTSQAVREDDFYFAGLPKELVSQGHSVLIVLIDHIAKPDSTLAKHWKENAIPRVILSRTLDLGAEKSFRDRMKREARRLRKHSETETDPLRQRVLIRAAVEALSGGAQGSLRMDQQISTLVGKLRPKAIMVTYEGYALERIAFSAARRAQPTVTCLGYQHSVIFPLQHAIRRNLAREYNPDQILTAGSISKAQLEVATDLTHTPISVLGSNRGVKSSVPPSTSEERLSDQRNACLVLPEGIKSECYLLFEFSLVCAHACPEIPFIWHLHPLFSFSALAAGNPKLKKLPPNITMSEGTLESAVDQSRWVLYRGTTAVVKAVLDGVRPIYLESKNELPIDSLSGMGNWRRTVTTTGDFRKVIGEDQQLKMGSGEKQSVKSGLYSAQEYCASLFTPFDSKVLSELLSAN